MKEEQNQFLRLLGQLPTWLTAEQAAWVLNCQPHDVPVLVAARLLKPLDNPPQHSVKYFATPELLEQIKDQTWLANVTNALNQYWQKKNAAKRGVPLPGLSVNYWKIKCLLKWWGRRLLLIYDKRFLCCGTVSMIMKGCNIQLGQIVNLDIRTSRRATRVNRAR